MRKVYSCTNTIPNLSRAQTSKMRNILIKTLHNIKIKQSSTKNKNTESKRPKTSFSYLGKKAKINQKYILAKENNNNIQTPYRTIYSRPNTSPKNINKINNDQNIKINEKNGQLSPHLNDILNQKLISEILNEKKNKEMIEDYEKKLQYRKLIMRAKLLKAIKSSIILKESQYNEFQEKYSTGNKLLSDKIKNRGKIVKEESSDDISESDSDKKGPERPDFYTPKHPDIFSKYEVTSPFQDFYCTPLELIKKVFNTEEQKIINLDPIYFRLDKEPFTGVQKNLRFCLKNKIDEEDRIFKEKIKYLKEKNNKNYHKKNLNQKKVIKGCLSEIKRKNKDEENIFGEKNINDENSDIKQINKISSYSKSNVNIHTLNLGNNELNKRRKIFKIKGNNNLGINSKSNKIKIMDKIKKNDKNIYLNLKTDYNTFQKSHRLNNKNTINLSNPLTNPVDLEDEKMSDKKKRLTMQEIFEIYKEKKKLYFEDVIYNRNKNKLKYEKLRIENSQNLQYEKQKEENLRKLVFNIEQNYKSQNIKPQKIKKIENL